MSSLVVVLPKLLSVTNGQVKIPDMRETAQYLEPYLTRLRTFPFVEGAAVARAEARMGNLRADAILRLRTTRGVHELFLEIKRTHLTRAVVDGLLARVRPNERRRWILLAPYVGAGIGEYLRENGMNYLDVAGNCFLATDEEHFALIEGKRLERRGPRERGVRAAGHQVLFAILAKPDLLNARVRVLADAAGVGKTAAAEMLTRLQAEGLVGADQKGRRLLQPQFVLDRWLAGYTAVVRPRLLVGRFSTNDPDPGALEHRIEAELGDRVAWAWGGGAAAMRLTRHYRGEETILHLGEPLPQIGRELKAIPSGDGPLIVLGVPGRVAFEGVVPRTVHPLLVYTELLAAGHERAREAAEDVWNRRAAWTDR